jgi:hypothetical protein
LRSILSIIPRSERPRINQALLQIAPSRASLLVVAHADSVAHAARVWKPISTRPACSTEREFRSCSELRSRLSPRDGERVSTFSRAVFWGKTGFGSGMGVDSVNSKESDYAIDSSFAEKPSKFRTASDDSFKATDYRGRFAPTIGRGRS